VEGALKLSRLATVLDELWFLARDGRWHTRQDLASESSFEPEAVNAALGFLVKYGFAQSLGGAEMMIRVTGGPSPNEVASVLSVLALDNERESIYA
jgi:hypothetical protein